MFRFTIRDLLWLTVVVALGVGWCVTQYRASAERKRLTDAALRIAGQWADAVGHEVQVSLPDGQHTVSPMIP
jgi:hypothetical protein